MMSKKDLIGPALGIEPYEEKGKIIDVLPIIKAEKNNDYEYARSNLYNVIEKGQTALDDILDVAKQSESARVYEVATNLIKTMVDANKDLLALQKARKELERMEEPVENKKTVTNNNLFVGSSAELLKMIKDKSSE